MLLERLKGTVDRFEVQVAYAANNLLFSFVEGSLVEALTEGHWLLLDEINLASPETFEHFGRFTSFLFGFGHLDGTRRFHAHSTPPEFPLVRLHEPGHGCQ